MSSAAPDDDDSDGVEQRVVSATDAPPPATSAASSVFNWRGAGTAAAAAPEPDPDPQSPPPRQPQEEETMPRHKAARVMRRKPIPLILQLLAGGDLPRGDIGEQLQLAPSVLSRNLAKLKDDGLAVVVGDNFRITKAGRESLGTPEDEPAPARKARAASTGRGKKHARRGRKKVEQSAAELDTSPIASAKDEDAFRCAVMSDGCFWITKEGTSIELAPAEHAQMLHYLERMAEAA